MNNEKAQNFTEIQKLLNKTYDKEVERIGGFDSWKLDRKEKKEEKK